MTTLLALTAFFTLTTAAGAAFAPVLEDLQSERQAARALHVKKCLEPLNYSPRALLVAPWNRTERADEARADRIRAASAGTHRCRLWPASWEAGAMCVHRHEGAWNSNTGNGYYGGMQMDSSFQRTHGPDILRKYGGRFAHVWSVHDQLLVSWRAYSGTGPGSYGPRGWHPWPNTARMCGLL